MTPDSSNASIAVLYFDPRSSTEQNEVRRQLGLDAFPFASRFSVSPLQGVDGSAIDFSTTLGLLRASERLEQILCELASQTQPDVPHGTVALKQLLEPSSDSIIQRSYQSYRNGIDETKSTLPLTTTSPAATLSISSLPTPSALAFEWNQLLGSVWKSIVSEELLGVNWPAPETLRLFPFLESHGWPTASWNTPAAFDHLTNFIMSFIIDDVAVQNALESSPSEENWLELESVSRYVTALISSHARLEGFVPHASIVLQQFKERLDAAQLTARKTGRIPVLLPFSWHALFELVYSFLLEQMAHEMVCLDISSIPMTAKVPEEDRQWKRARRDRQLSEANTWTSWYQELCPTVEAVRKQEHERLKKENPQQNFSALLGQFSPVASPSSRGLSFAVPESPRMGRSPYATIPTPYKAPPPSTGLSPPPFSLEASSPLPLKASSSSTPQAASPAIHRTVSPTPTVSADSLHDRLRSLQDRLSRMTDSTVTANRAPKRRAEEAPYALPPPQAKRKAD